MEQAQVSLDGGLDGRGDNFGALDFTEMGASEAAALAKRVYLVDVPARRPYHADLRWGLPLAE